jgi:hypothetical protein
MGKTLDDLMLSAQIALDRAIRRMRRGAPPPVAERKFLVVQIDGLSRAMLEHGMERGHAPFLKRLLKRDGYAMDPMSVGLPTSTPAFQMAAFYGVRPDIPGFHYYSREKQGDIHFPRSGHAAWVEKSLPTDRPGILQGGSAYGCCFTGGAVDNFFTFTSLTQPSGKGLASALSPFIVVAWVAGKSIALTAWELAKVVPRVLRHPRRPRRGWRWLYVKIVMGIWVRNYFTMAVARDLYEGKPAIYVNYLGYDEMAHAEGPRSGRAMQALREVDRAIAALWAVMRRVPEHRYDAYVLADHGQSDCKPYQEVTHGKRLERWIFDAFLHPEGAAAPEAPRVGLRRGIRARRAETPAMMQRFMNYTDEDYYRRADPEAFEKGGVRAISAGPNAFLYAKDSREPLDEAALQRRFPGLARKLSASPGIGFVLARGQNGGGPVCYWRGNRCELADSQPGPFAERDDAALVLEGIGDLMRMPSAGDLVIYGNDTPDGTVSFIPERGAHAGPSAAEMQTFILRPRHVTLPADITHPTQLYAHFLRYHSPERRAT